MILTPVVYFYKMTDLDSDDPTLDIFMNTPLDKLQMLQFSLVSGFGFILLGFCQFYLDRL